MKKYYVALICLTSLPLCASDKAGKENAELHKIRGLSVAAALYTIGAANDVQVMAHKTGGKDYACAPGTPAPTTSYSLYAVLKSTQPQLPQRYRQPQRPKFNNASFKAIRDHLYGPDKDASECSTPPHEKPSSPITVPAPLTDKL